MSDANINTDREIWRVIDGDYYADSIFVTEHNSIGINCGGEVFIKPIKEWHRLAKKQIDHPCCNLKCLGNENGFCIRQYHCGEGDGMS